MRTCRLQWILPFAFLAGSVCAADITLIANRDLSLTSPRPPAESVEAAVLRVLMSQTSLSVNVVKLPWARAFHQARTTPRHCIVSLARLPQRESDFEWIGPIAFNEWTFFALRERKLSIHKIEDLKPLRIGAQRSDAHAMWLLAQGLEIDYSRSEELVLRKLARNRIDVYPANLSDRGSIARLLERPVSDVEPVWTFHTAENYLGCNPATPQEHLAQLRRAWSLLQRDGTLEKIWRQYQQAVPDAYRSHGGSK